MKTLFIFCFCVSTGLPLYAELARRDRVAYTLDYYETEIKIKENTGQAESFFTKASPGKKQKRKRGSTKPKPDKKERIAPAKDKRKTLLNKASIEGKTIMKNIAKNTHPYAMLVEQYNDNIYLLRNDRKIDYITKIYPGLAFKGRTTNNRAGLYIDMGFESLIYARERQNNHESPYGKGMFEFDSRNLGLATSVDVRRSRGTPSALTDVELAQFIDAWNYDYQQSAKLKFNRFETEAQYNYNDVQYLEEEYKSGNSMRNTIGLRNSLKIFPKTSLFVESAHSWLNYKKNVSNNWSSDKYFLGLKGKIFTKLEGTVKAGYTFTRSKSRKDVNGDSVNINLTYKASPRLYCRLNAVKTIGGIGLLNAGATKARGISLGTSFLPRFPKRLRLNADLSYWQNGSDYATRDNFWRFSFKPEYRIKMFTVGLAYNFEQKRSKTKSHEYKNNIVGLNLAAEF